jgi:hypothetical protein
MKIITKIAFGLILIGVLGGVLTTFPNELALKFYNKKGVFAFEKKDWLNSRENFHQASLKFNPWQLAEKNNELSILYEQKKYSELNKELKNILKNDCSLSAPKIPSFCENIFYLAGLTQYRLGETLTTKEQKPFFERAIFEFQKTLALNPSNIWAKENIDFILKKFAEKQQQEQQKQDQKSDKNNKNSQEKNKDFSEQGAQENSTKNESEKENQSQQQSSSKDVEQKDNQSTSVDKNSSSSQNKEEQLSQNDKTSKSSAGKEEDSAKNEPTPSRLPENIQQALEQTQQDLEQDKNQQGFNRSRSAAENNQNLKDPFQDDFFQNFFGNDPFFNNFFGGRNEKKFHKNISNPNEKDW